MRRLVILLVVGVGLLIAAACLPVATYLVKPHWDDWVNRAPFDSDAWKAADGSQVRLNMVEDLLAHHTFTGKAEAEVVGLLGPPSERWMADHFPNAGFEESWAYNMGGDRHSLGPDYAYLVVGFRQGRVVTTWRYSD